ncbi:MAG: hypothetical protein AMJ54_12055 [Deltaproteobacteria bacterium SG8_13]|nr:MAG: hypothetical protein AMJ54_12055 [Deltaproteobacteria bacterium SG8_13]
MILTCTECDTSFNFDDRLIKPSGSKVRCSKCHSVFTAYPQGEAAAAPAAGAVPAAAASSAAAGLDDLDLDAITADLDLELDAADEEPSEAVSDGDELDFDLGLEDDVAESPAGADVQYQETQELDLSDFDLDEATDSAEVSDAAAADDDLAFDLDLDESSAADGEDLTIGDTATEEAPDLDFDLGLELDADGQAADSAAAEETGTGAAADDDLDFSLDLDMDEQPAADDAVSAGGDLDPDLMDETRAMDLGELDDLLASDEGLAEETDSAGEADGLDIDLDLEADVKEESIEEDSTEELDFDLDLDADESPAGDQQAAPAMEETEELDLADLEEMIEVEGDAGAETPAEDASGDFELDLDMVETGAADDDIPMEETEELDLTGLEDALELEEPSGGAADDDMDLELDFDSSGQEPAVADELEEDDEGDFDLTDLDDMLEMDEGEEEVPAAAAGEDDFDLELEVDDAGMAHEFEVEDDEGRAATAAAVAAEDGPGGEGMEDSFDMGTVAGLDETIEDETYFDDDQMPYDAGKPAKKAGGGISRPFKILLVLFLLVGGGYGAVTLLNFFDIEVPFVDTLKEMEIPYVSDWLGPKDSGNLNIAILEKQLEGSFVESAKLGTLYVVRGKVKNNYQHPRSYINITGKLYTKGGKLNQTKTVYAGSSLADQRLAALNQAQLTRRENNRNGAKRSNVNVPRGKELPFMIVFSNLPPNLDEYSVEVAGSEKAK